MNLKVLHYLIVEEMFVNFESCQQLQIRAPDLARQAVVMALKVSMADRQAVTWRRIG